MMTPTSQSYTRKYRKYIQKRQKNLMFWCGYKSGATSKQPN